MFVRKPRNTLLAKTAQFKKNLNSFKKEVVKENKLCFKKASNRKDNSQLQKHDQISMYLEHARIPISGLTPLRIRPDRGSEKDLSSDEDKNKLSPRDISPSARSPSVSS